MRKLWILSVMLFAVSIVVPMAAQAPGHGKNQKAPESAAPDTMRDGGSDAPSAADLNAIFRIKDEGFNRSQVMDIMSYLTDVYGPRLTNSPNVKEAGKWTIDKLNEWQLANVHQESWGPFGRGWSNERFSAQMIAPRPFELIAYPKAWTPGLGSSPVTADAVLVPMTTEEEFAEAQTDFKGQLKGKFVLTAKPQEITPHYEADAHRYTDAELAEMATDEIPASRAQDRAAQFRAMRELQTKVQKFLLDEGIAAWIETSPHDDGTVIAQSGGSRDPKDPPTVPRIVLASEHYGRL